MTARSQASLPSYRDRGASGRPCSTQRRSADILRTGSSGDRPAAEIDAMARRLLPVAKGALGEEILVSLADCRSQIGSGALPMSTLPSGGLALAPKGGGRALDALAAALRRLPVPVIGRIEDGALVLDLR